MAGVISCDSKMRLRNIVDQFPEEMLLNIFGFLDLKSVKNVISVNKR